jgi:selenide,water dikinase
MKRLVLIGGGHSHVEVLRRFGMQPPARAELVLVSPHRDTPYSGMLPGWIAGHYTRSDCHIDLAPLAGFARCRWLQTSCNGINPDARLVFCENGQTLPFDVVSVDIGSRSPALETPGALEHALAVRPIDRFMAAWEEVCRMAAAGHPPRHIAMVGAGAAGAEVLLSMQHRLREIVPALQTEFELIGDEPELLPGHNASARAILKRVLEARGVKLRPNSRVERVDRGRLQLHDGATISTELIAWATGASPSLWPRSVGLATDNRGFILVNDALQSVSHPGVFAAGDIATVRNHPRPKSGVFAVRAGPPLEHNLRRALQDLPPVAWQPQRHALALITTGDRHAIASRGDLALQGDWVWQWKNWIDRRFMRRYAIRG